MVRQSRWYAARLLRTVIVAELAFALVFVILTIWWWTAAPEMAAGPSNRLADGLWEILLLAAMAASLTWPCGWWLLWRQVRPVERIERVLANSLANSPAKPSAGPAACEGLSQAVRQGLGMWATLGQAIDTFRDDTRQHLNAVTAQSHRCAQLLDAIPDGVVSINQDQRVVVANASAARLFAFDRPCHGRRLADLVRPYEVHRAVERALRHRVDQHIELLDDGQPRRWMSVHVMPLVEADQHGATLVVSDMTELRRLESLRQDFVANVSHELKTPLTAIKAYAETLAGGAIHDQRMNVKFVRGIEEQAERLHRLILDMLSLARIEAGRTAFEITRIPVDHVVRACLADHQAAARARSIDLHYPGCPPDVAARADEEGLRDILNNLIDNAIKYSHDHGVVHVAVRAEAQHVVLTVQDSGIGIAPEHLDRLFERFYRVDKARSRQLGGTGLGLSIVKHLTQVFGGHVEVESTPGRGSRFSIHLPRHQ